MGKNDIIVIGALGIAALWLFSRGTTQAQATATPYTAGGGAPQNLLVTIQQAAAKASGGGVGGGGRGIPVAPPIEPTWTAPMVKVLASGAGGTPIVYNAPETKYGQVLLSKQYQVVVR